MTLLAVVALAPATSASAATRPRAVVRTAAPAPHDTHPASCGDAPLPDSCRDGGAAAATLSAEEVERLARGAAGAIDEPAMTVAVVDRAGRVLALYRNPAADPGNDDKAVGLARTAAFFSHNMAPLSSRTVRFISGVHFPPGVKRAASAALYGIENTNRGCELHVPFNEGKCLPRATSLSGAPCNAFDASGCGTGPVTGKADAYDGHEGGVHPSALGLRASGNPDGLPVEPGGIPIYRVAGVRVASGSLPSGDAIVEATGPGAMLGGVGVTGTSTPEAAEFAAFAAIASAGGNLFPAPSFPLPFPGAVIIDGFRLPFVEQGARPAGASAGSPDAGTFAIGPAAGGCAPNRYLSGPSATADLAAQEVDAIVRRAVESAQRTRGAIRLPLNSYARMVIAVSDLDGNIAALYRMPDATVFSIDVAVAKARNVVWFSGAGSADLAAIPKSAVTNRTIGYAAQPMFPSGIDYSEPGPFFDLFVRDLVSPCTQGSQPANANQNGVVFFAGSLPLYRNGKLIGGLGVSGDGVEQDDLVSWDGAEGYRAPRELWPDRASYRGARMPFLKFPRQPRGVTETVSEPFDEP